jgi:hypothetical protein
MKKKRSNLIDGSLDCGGKLIKISHGIVEIKEM